jgi:hypothetical protein
MFSLLLALALGTAEAVPLTFTQQGRLLDTAGAGLDGAHELHFAIYDAAASGSEVWSETQSVLVSQGHYAARLGAVTPLDAGAIAGERWLAISVDDGPELSPRLPLDSVPFAFHALNAEEAAHALNADSATSAEHATSADTATSATSADHATTADSATSAATATVAEGLAEGASVNLTEVAINGVTVIDGDGNIAWDRLTGAPVQLDDLGCSSDGSVALYDRGAWKCGTLPSGGVTSVTAGAGLSGGTITGEGTVAIANNGVVPGMIASDAAALAKVTGGKMSVTTHGGLRVGNMVMGAWSASIPSTFNGTGYSERRLQIKTALRCDNGGGQGYMWHLEFLGHDYTGNKPFKTVSVGYSQASYPDEIQNLGSTQVYGAIAVTPYCSAADSSGRKYLSFELDNGRGGTSAWHASDLVINILHGGSGYEKQFTDGFAVTDQRAGNRF